MVYREIQEPLVKQDQWVDKDWQDVLAKLDLPENLDGRDFREFQVPADKLVQWAQ